MGKCYNVSFDSAFFTGGGNNNKRTYATNWTSVLPANKAFKVSFSFMSETAVLPNAIVMCLDVNLGQSNSYATISPSLLLATNYFMGFLKIQPLAGTTNAYYYADHTTNAPIYLAQRPTATFLEIELHEGLSNVNYTTPVPSDYVITFHFEEYD
jgi:hypothetical protein